MSREIPAKTLVALFRAEGLTVKLVPGSSARCRCHNGSHARGGPHVRGWEPINGTMNHITAGNVGRRTVLQYIRDIINGDPKIPDKAQFVISADGVLWINSFGRSNHAGRISRKSLNRAIAGKFSTSGWDDQRGGVQVDGNARFYGIENIAAAHMTPAQYDSTVRVNAAIARHLGWDGRESVGHGECSSSRGYADPGVNTGKLRLAIMKRIAKPASARKPTRKEDDMPTAKELLGADLVPSPHNNDTNKFWRVSSMLGVMLRNSIAQTVDSKAMRSDIAEMLELQKSQAKKQGVSAQEVEEASRKGAAKALDDKILDSDVTLNVAGGE